MLSLDLFSGMTKTKFFFSVAAAALLIAGGRGQQARAERNDAVRPDGPPAQSTAAFKLTFYEQPPAGYAQNSKFTKPADNTQEYNYTELPNAAQGTGLPGREKRCARFIHGMSYGRMDAAGGEVCAKGCEEIYRHDPGVGANLPLECEFMGRSVYDSPKQKPVSDTPAQIKAVRDRFFVQDGYHQIVRADLTENDKGWVVFLRIKGNRIARYNLSIPAEAGGCGTFPWIGIPNVDQKTVELRPGESTVTLEIAADELSDKLRKALSSLSVDLDSCKTAVFMARLTPELPAESPYIGWTWLPNNMSFTVPISRFIGKQLPAAGAGRTAKPVPQTRPCRGTDLEGIFEMVDMVPGTETLSFYNRAQAFRFGKNGRFLRGASNNSQLLVKMLSAAKTLQDSYTIDDQGYMLMRYSNGVTDRASCSAALQSDTDRKCELILSYFSADKSLRFKLFLRKAIR